MFLPNDLSYILNEYAEERESYFNAVSPPIMQTSNFTFKKVEDMRTAFEDEMSGYLYSRGLNPTVEILRRKLAALDGAEDCLVFSSGAAAIFAGVLSNVKAGDHIVSVRNPYTWAQRTFDVILPRFGVTTTYIDGREIKNFENAIQSNTTLIYLESPNSWDYALQDIKAVADLARSRNILTMIDNSYCTPLYQRPIDLGIDLCMQTATKYIGGHSDALGGVLSGSRQMIKKIFDSEFLNVGSGIQPFNAWLLIRGLRTLPARFERITRSTIEVVNFLKQHDKVEKLIFGVVRAVAAVIMFRALLGFTMVKLLGGLGVSPAGLRQVGRQRPFFFSLTVRVWVGGSRGRVDNHLAGRIVQDGAAVGQAGTAYSPIIDFCL